ncbi:uncharacterized protein [Antennarius striatus]|uniref:uncharacterized protein n=1 Tax=Antennarius striatus TaxID=241820 RepID=UPI0035B19AF0
MADWVKTCWGLRLLVLFSLLSLTELFEVRDNEWEELRPDIAALHRLRGLHYRMSHEISNPRNILNHGARVERSISRGTIDQNPMDLQEDLEKCHQSFTSCVIQKKMDFGNFFDAIDKHKIDDKLMKASEISDSYSHKLLIMTDYDKSTHDRALQEYSVDPHYSQIVSKNCLNDVSCVPEANGNTVVKIFGTVSEDGQTVSGLSGSSLAVLMLKPSLKAAPVFSIDGNTSSHFQYSFIRIFMVRGVKAVLQINKGYQQIYQVMNEPEDSRLVLVGHGMRESSGEMKLSGYTAQEVAEIIKDTSRVGNDIKTISVVACELGSDNVFVETLLKELREKANIETELHLRDAVIQDLITFAISEKKADCQQTDPFSKCIKSLRIDYSSSPSSLGLDLEEDEALSSVTEIRGSDFNDVIRGNKEHNVISPGKGLDYIQGPGEDLVDGGPGRDTVVYRGDPVMGKGVYVNLLTGQGHYADAEGDVLKDVETVIGTIYADILVSGYESALLKGSEEQQGP